MNLTFCRLLILVSAVLSAQASAKSSMDTYSACYNNLSAVVDPPVPIRDRPTYLDLQVIHGENDGEQGLWIIEDGMSQFLSLDGLGVKTSVPGYPKNPVLTPANNYSGSTILSLYPTNTFGPFSLGGFHNPAMGYGYGILQPLPIEKRRGFRVTLPSGISLFIAAEIKPGSDSSIVADLYPRNSSAVQYDNVQLGTPILEPKIGRQMQGSLLQIVSKFGRMENPSRLPDFSKAPGMQPRIPYSELLELHDADRQETLISNQQKRNGSHKKRNAKNRRKREFSSAPSRGRNAPPRSRSSSPKPRIKTSSESGMGQGQPNGQAEDPLALLSLWGQSWSKQQVREYLSQLDAEAVLRRFRERKDLHELPLWFANGIQEASLRSCLESLEKLNPENTDPELLGLINQKINSLRLPLAPVESDGSSAGEQAI